MNSAMKKLAAERAARNGSALPRHAPKARQIRRQSRTVRRVAFDDGAASLDDLRAESGADELFADEACTQHAVQEDLKHGAVVYARHNAAEEGEGDAMAEDDEG